MKSGEGLSAPPLPPCHAQYARGRLVISVLGDGCFCVEVTRGAEKWAIRA
jgi:hypothetical protein